MPTRSAEAIEAELMILSPIGASDLLWIHTSNGVMDLLV